LRVDYHDGVMSDIEHSFYACRTSPEGGRILWNPSAIHTGRNSEPVSRAKIRIHDAARSTLATSGETGIPQPLASVHQEASTHRTRRRTLLVQRRVGGRSVNQWLRRERRRPTINRKPIPRRAAEEGSGTGSESSAITKSRAPELLMSPS